MAPVLLVLVYLAMAVGVVVPADTAAAAAPVRIMPLGDSITDGFNIPGGYRITLEDDLAAGGHAFDFVGSLANGPAALADRQHEGHSGYRIDQIHASVNNWLWTHQPDVVLLMIGTNDMRQSHDLANAPKRLGALIDRILYNRPNLRLVVSSIPPLSNSAQNQSVNAYNAAVPGVVQARAGKGKRVSFVDARATLSLAHLADGIHPNAEGYRRIAATFRGGLASTFPPGGTTTTTAAPTTTTSPTSTSTTSTSTTSTTAPPAGGALVVDSFQRADHASSLGSAEVGGTWASFGTTWGVAGGRARAVSGTGEGVALVESGAANVVVSASVTLSPTVATPGLSFRAVDHRNQLMVGLTRRSNADRISLYKIVNGTYTLLREAPAAGLVPGRSYAMAARLDGARIQVSVDGAVRVDHTLSSADMATFGSRTRHGLRTWLSATNDDGQSRWDDFRIAAVGK